MPWSAHTKALVQTRRPVKPRIIRLSSTRLHPSIPPAPTHSPTRCSRTRLAGGTTSDATGSVAPPGFCNRGEVRYGSIEGLEYEVPQSRLYCLCIDVVLCSTALQCICRVIRRSSMTMKAHTYYIIFGRPPIGGKLPPFPLAALLLCCKSLKN